MLKKLSKLNKKGFTLIEVMVSLMLISMITVIMYNIIILSLKVTADNAGYVEAMSLANQKMEQIRNMPYFDVGTASGSPNGLIPDNLTVNQYNVHTIVIYHDDPYDGTIASGTDIIHDDYKIATINIEWEGKFESKKITVFSKIIPATEETNSGNGLLKISVVNANGVPVVNANINIKNNLLLPTIDVDLVSDSNGILAYSAPPSFEGYEITVTKAGYGVDRTYTRDAVNLNPSKPHLSVAEGVKTEESFQIDLLSLLLVTTITQTLPSNWIAGDDTSDDQTNSRIAIDNNGFIYAVWQDYRQTGKPKILGQKYDKDGNNKWALDAVIANATDSVLPDILVDTNGNLFATWHDDDVGDKQIYVIKLLSADGSVDWGGSKVETLANSADQTNVRITLLEKSGTATSTVVWQDDRTDGGDLFIQQFKYTNGNQIWASEIKVNDSVDGTIQSDPTIASDSNDNFYVAWTDNRNSIFDIYAEKFDSNGNNLWATNIKMYNDASSSNQYMPEIAVDSLDNIYITWTDERNGNKNIYLQKYDSNSNSLWTNDLLVNSNTGTSNQYSSSIGIDTDDNIYIAWTDDRNGNEDIYTQKISTSSLKLWTEDVRVNIDLGTTAQYNSSVTIDPSTNPDTPYVTWQGNINGDEDIFISSFGEYGTSSTKASIPFNLKGSKKIGDNPIIYEHDQNYISDLNGEISIVLEWDNPGYTASSTNILNNLIFATPTMPIDILPGETRNLILFLE
ncbi:prepilin-type N-terminal cleavage/methylation domain-containing protein [Candidatus Parcubacteria bacterium]|nr:prepilin-type N-terminal cleavage/methylation domain-containing protein [Candidatus Parcubacteria bacterium]